MDNSHNGEKNDEECREGKRFLERLSKLMLIDNPVKGGNKYDYRESDDPTSAR